MMEWKTSQQKLQLLTFMKIFFSLLMKCQVLTFLQKYLFKKCPSLFMAQKQSLSENELLLCFSYSCASYILVIGLQTSQCTECCNICYYNKRCLILSGPKHKLKDWILLPRQLIMRGHFARYLNVE